MRRLPKKGVFSHCWSISLMKLQVKRGFALALVVIGRAADPHQGTMPYDTEPGMSGIYHLHPPAVAQRLKALAKKSRSTVSSPILA
jgi:hypothetical protein